MLTKDIRQATEISIITPDTGLYAPRTHHFYELTYIQEGCGTHEVNSNTYTYQKGKMFFLAPNDKHTFHIEIPTRLAIIRFTDASFSQLKAETEQIEYCDWVKKMAYIFHNYHAKAGCLYKDKNDETLGHALMEGIVREHINQGTGYLLIIRQSIAVLLNLVARNLMLTEVATPSPKNDKPSVMKIIAYLQQHIHQPELLKMPVLAKEFNISVNYLGEYFTKSNGESIQQYIIHYRLKLIETRLLYSNLRVNEIAQEMNFTDESHLSRIFKKYRGITPGAYRKANKKDLQQ